MHASKKSKEEEQEASRGIWNMWHRKSTAVAVEASKQAIVGPCYTVRLAAMFYT
jgi:hypothetical protein